MNQKHISYPKIILAVIVALYFLNYATRPHDWRFFDNIDLLNNVDLLIHEAGHVIFIFFGQFLHFLGGSLFQVLFPFVFVLYFYFREEYFSSSILLFWVGQNLINVSVYAGDAIVMQLPLLGGDGGIHDWNWLLSTTGLLKYTSEISSLFFVSGLVLGTTALVFSLMYSYREKTEAGHFWI